MSILLDALKKSEAQRRLGQAPDIYSGPGAEPSTASRGRKWLLWSLLAVVIVIAAWMAWRQLQPVDTSAESREDGHQVAMPDAAAEEAAGSGQQQPAIAMRESPGEQESRRRRTPVESLAADAVSEPVDTVTPENDQPDIARKAQVKESFTEFSAAQENSEEQPRTAAAAGPAKSVAAPAPQEPASRAATADAPAPGSNPISFWELPQDVRDSLPDLHITVLVYAEEPTERFVLIGGKRLVEKEQVGQGVVLEEIRREGAVFRYRNYLFQVNG